MLRWIIQEWNTNLQTKKRISEWIDTYSQTAEFGNRNERIENCTSVYIWTSIQLFLRNFLYWCLLNHFNRLCHLNSYLEK